MASAERMEEVLGSATKKSLELLNLRIIKKGSLLQQLRGEVICKQGEIRNLKARIGAAETCITHSCPPTPINLEMQQPLWVYHNIPFIKLLDIDRVGRGGYKARENGALHHEKQLGSSRVSVHGNNAACGQIEAGYGEAEAVEARELSIKSRGNSGTDDVCGVSGLSEARKHEVFGGDVARVLARVPARGLRAH